MLARSAKNSFRLALVLALIPAPAAANAGVGFFTLPWPVVLLALIPAIVLEGCVLALILRLPPRRAFSLSLAANLESTVYGFLIGFAMDGLLCGRANCSAF